MKNFKLRLATSTSLVVAIASLLVLSSVLPGCKKTDDMLPMPELPDSHLNLSSFFQKYHIVEIDAAAVYQQALQAGANGSFEVTIPNGSDRPWIVTLTQNDLFSPNFKAIEIGQAGETEHKVDIIALKGYIKDSDEEVRFTVSPDFFGGILEANGEVFYIEPIVLYQGTSDRSSTHQCVVYNQADVIQSTPGYCEELHIEGMKSPEHPNSPASVEDRAANCWKLEVRAHADWEFYTLRALSNYNLGVLLIALNFNSSELKFGVVNMDFQVLQITIFTNPQNPLYYQTSNNAATLLSQTRNFWNFFHPNLNRDLVVLFTGKNIHLNNNYNTIGIAYTGVICTSSGTWSYAVVETGLSGNLQTTVLAHEIGHTLGAAHTTAGIMRANLPTTNLNFSDVSITQISWHLLFNHGCLSLSPCW